MNSCQVEFCFSFEKHAPWHMRFVHGPFRKCLRKAFFLADSLYTERGEREIDSDSNGALIVPSPCGFFDHR
jgi:hypothetical protein